MLQPPLHSLFTTSHHLPPPPTISHQLPPARTITHSPSPPQALFMQRFMTALEQQGGSLITSQPLQWLATYTNAGALTAITLVCVVVSVPSIITVPYACCVCWALGRWALGRSSGYGGVHAAWMLQSYTGVHLTLLYVWQLPLPWDSLGGVVRVAAVLGLYHVEEGEHRALRVRGCVARECVCFGGGRRVCVCWWVGVVCCQHVVCTVHVVCSNVLASPHLLSPFFSPVYVIGVAAV